MAQMGRDFNGGNPAPAGLGSDADSDSDTEGDDRDEGQFTGIEYEYRPSG
jgi:hypothetical protein